MVRYSQPDDRFRPSSKDELHTVQGSRSGEGSEEDAEAEAYATHDSVLPSYPEPSYTSAYQSSYQPLDLLFSDSSVEQDVDRAAPSLPIILISAACGIASGVFGLYIGYVLLNLSIPLSAGLATLSMLFGLGISGAALTAAIGQRGAFYNMLFSCTLIVLVILFMTICATVGAIVATMLVRA